MATQTQQAPPGFKKLELRTAYGPVYRDVSTNPPREARSDEIPVIDLDPIHGDLEARKILAAEIRKAATNTGFFYIKNHGVSEAAIKGALNSSKAFFSQPYEKKNQVSIEKAKYFNGFTGKQTSKASPSEGLDYRESFSWMYLPEYDPVPKDPDTIPEEVKEWFRGESFIWDKTSDIPNFKQGCMAYYQECLQLARKLVKIFALCLDLPEDYFDKITTFPGADGVFNYYPAVPEGQTMETVDIGLGSHTDLQCFTLLWQDMNGGLQVLNKDGQWIKATPIEGTFIVNIADYMQRLSNDKLKSTVHRVFNRSTVDRYVSLTHLLPLLIRPRYSMPFFFGFNFNEKCGVLPSCITPDNPAKYEPVSCGDWSVDSVLSKHVANWIQVSASLQANIPRRQTLTRQRSRGFLQNTFSS
jgi:isopenicillin N synthase-like dioxygenase